MENGIIRQDKNQLNSVLLKMKDQIQMALPSHMRAEVVIRTVLTAVTKTPKLLECSQASLLGAIVQSSQLGLMPDGILGEAYLIPFKIHNTMTCQFIPGYRGLVQLAHRSGKVRQIYAEAVYETDEFKYEFGLIRTMTHKPNPSRDKVKEKIVYFYSVIHYTNGGFDFEVLSKADVDHVRAKSQGKNNAVWVDYYEEMGKKTVLRKLLKMAPLSTELQRAVALDEQATELNKSQNNAANLLMMDLPDDIKIDADNTYAQEMSAEQEENKAQVAEKAKEEASNKAAGALKATEEAMNAGKPAETAQATIDLKTTTKSI